MQLVRDVKDNKKEFYKCFGSKKKAKESASPSLNAKGNFSNTFMPHWLKYLLFYFGLHK